MIIVINIAITGCRLIEGAYFDPAFVYAAAIFYAPVADTEHTELRINFALAWICCTVDGNTVDIIQVDGGTTPIFW